MTMPFSSLGLSASLLNAIAEKKYTQAYPIQEQAIPVILQGKDLIGIAQTGSGKTASFVLPILELLKNKQRSKNRHVAALVLVPTRELAVQIEEVFKEFSAKLSPPLKTLAVFGGVSINIQMIQMQGVEILVATPGRLLELIGSNAVHLAEVEILVLDEADKMLNIGFKEEMNRLLECMPEKRQNLLFSATLSNQLDTYTKIILRDPVKIEIAPPDLHLDLITQLAYHIPEEKKGPLLRYIIKQHNMSQVLIFTSSVHRADSVVAKLKGNGINAAALHSKKSQGARTETLRQFKAGALPVLVATDLASRGIDIQFLPFVINYELPRSPKDYIHRIGRTGRAESAGTAISLVSPEEEHHFKVIQKKMRKQVEVIDAGLINLHGF